MLIYAAPVHDDYRARVRALLGLESARASVVLQRMADAADGSRLIAVDVFVEQDAEGPFDVMARFDGPDAFALDRRFDDERRIFEVVWGEAGWEPDVPPRPQEWTRRELEAVLVELVADWLEPLVPATPGSVRWKIGAPQSSLVARDLRPLLDPDR